MVFIYALKLIHEKYYIGKTTNPSFRLDNHYNSNGSAWTIKYKPIELVELIPNCDDYDEDKYTRKYMDKYGIDNVRGGSFVSIELDKSTIQHLTQMSNGTNDKCFICSKTGHFANICNKYKKICDRCGRGGHTIDDCYAKKDINWETIEESEEEICSYCDKEFNTMKESICHENLI